MSKVVVVISGGRFLRELNLPDDETLTPQAVCNALAELTVEERQSLTDRCTLSEMIEDLKRVEDTQGMVDFYRNNVKTGDASDVFYERHLTVIETGLELLRQQLSVSKDDYGKHGNNSLENSIRKLGELQ